ncbi:MAG: STAS domain-containing protein [Pseudomonadales bacterium]
MIQASSQSPSASPGAASGGGFVAPARIGFDNFAAVRRDGETALQSAGTEFVVDLSDLQETNSVTVALLMAWFRLAHAEGKTVRFVGVPAGLMNIIEFSGLSNVLPVTARAAAGDGVEQE